MALLLLKRLQEATSSKQQQLQHQYVEPILPALSGLAVHALIPDLSRYDLSSTTGLQSVNAGGITKVWRFCLEFLKSLDKELPEEKIKAKLILKDFCVCMENSIKAYSMINDKSRSIFASHYELRDSQKTLGIKVQDTAEQLLRMLPVLVEGGYSSEIPERPGHSFVFMFDIKSPAVVMANSGDGIQFHDKQSSPESELKETKPVPILARPKFPQNNPITVLSLVLAGIMMCKKQNSMLRKFGNIEKAYELQVQKAFGSSDLSRFRMPLSQQKEIVQTGPSCELYGTVNIILCVLEKADLGFDVLERFQSYAYNCLNPPEENDLKNSHISNEFFYWMHTLQNFRVPRLLKIPSLKLNKSCQKACDVYTENLGKIEFFQSSITQKLERTQMIPFKKGDKMSVRMQFQRLALEKSFKKTKEVLSTAESTLSPEVLFQALQEHSQLYMEIKGGKNANSLFNLKYKINVSDFNTCLLSLATTSVILRKFSSLLQRDKITEMYRKKEMQHKLHFHLACIQLFAVCMSIYGDLSPTCRSLPGIVAAQCLDCALVILEKAAEDAYVLPDKKNETELWLDELEARNVAEIIQLNCWNHALPEWFALDEFVDRFRAYRFLALPSRFDKQRVHLVMTRADKFYNFKPGLPGHISNVFEWCDLPKDMGMEEGLVPLVSLLSNCFFVLHSRAERRVQISSSGFSDRTTFLNTYIDTVTENTLENLDGKMPLSEDQLGLAYLNPLMFSDLSNKNLVLFLSSDSETVESNRDDAAAARRSFNDSYESSTHCLWGTLMTCMFFPERFQPDRKSTLTMARILLELNFIDRGRPIYTSNVGENVVAVIGKGHPLVNLDWTSSPGFPCDPGVINRWVGSWKFWMMQEEKRHREFYLLMLAKLTCLVLGTNPEFSLSLLEEKQDKAEMISAAFNAYVSKPESVAEDEDALKVVCIFLLCRERSLSVALQVAIQRLSKIENFQSLDRTVWSLSTTQLEIIWEVLKRDVLISSVCNCLSSMSSPILLPILDIAQNELGFSGKSEDPAIKGFRYFPVYAELTKTSWPLTEDSDKLKCISVIDAVKQKDRTWKAGAVDFQSNLLAFRIQGKFTFTDVKVDSDSKNMVTLALQWEEDPRLHVYDSTHLNTEIPRFSLVPFDKWRFCFLDTLLFLGLRISSSDALVVAHENLITCHLNSNTSLVWNMEENTVALWRGAIQEGFVYVPEDKQDLKFLQSSTFMYKSSIMSMWFQETKGEINPKIASNRSYLRSAFINTQDYWTVGAHPSAFAILFQDSIPEYFPAFSIGAKVVLSTGNYTRKNDHLIVFLHWTGFACAEKTSLFDLCLAIALGIRNANVALVWRLFGSAFHHCVGQQETPELKEDLDRFREGMPSVYRFLLPSKKSTDHSLPLYSKDWGLKNKHLFWKPVTKQVDLEFSFSTAFLTLCSDLLQSKLTVKDLLIKRLKLESRQLSKQCFDVNVLFDLRFLPGMLLSEDKRQLDSALGIVDTLYQMLLCSLASKDLYETKTLGAGLKEFIKHISSIGRSRFHRPLYVVLFELAAGIIVRSEQMELVKEMIKDVTESKEHRPRVHQAIMGIGKTAVIIPLTIFYCVLHRPNHRFLFFIQPVHLTRDSALRVSYLLGIVFPNHVLVKHIQDLERDKESYLELRNLISHYKETAGSSLKMVVTIMSDTAAKFSYIRHYDQEYRMICDSRIDLFDEIDYMYLATRSESIVSYGRLAHPATNKFYCLSANDFLRTYWDFVIQLAYNQTVLSEVAEMDAFVNFTRKLTEALDTSVRSDENHLILRDKELIERIGKKLALTWSVCKRMVVNLEFGFKDNDTFVAVPYEAANRPSKHALFADPDVIAMSTCLCYRYTHLVQNKPMRPKDFQIVHSLVQKYDKYLGVSTLDQKKMGSTAELVRFFLRHFVLPECVFCALQQKSVSLMEIMGRQTSIYKTALSGTVRMQLPLYANPQASGQFDPLIRLDMNVQSKVFNTACRGKLLSFSNRKTLEEFLKKDTEHGALIDLAAIYKDDDCQEVAATLHGLKRCPVVFFNKNDQPFVYPALVSFSVWVKTHRLQTEKVFYFYDNVHTIGSDLPQTETLVGLCIVRLDNSYELAVQSMHRLRKLSSGQKCNWGVIEINTTARGPKIENTLQLLKTLETNSQLQHASVLKNQQCLQNILYLTRDAIEKPELYYAPLLYEPVFPEREEYYIKYYIEKAKIPSIENLTFLLYTLKTAETFTVSTAGATQEQQQQQQSTETKTLSVRESQEELPTPSTDTIVKWPDDYVLEKASPSGISKCLEYLLIYGSKGSVSHAKLLKHLGPTMLPSWMAILIVTDAQKGVIRSIFCMLEEGMLICSKFLLMSRNKHTESSNFHALLFSQEGLLLFQCCRTFKVLLGANTLTISTFLSGSPMSLTQELDFIDNRLKISKLESQVIRLLNRPLASESLEAFCTIKSRNPKWKPDAKELQQMLSVWFGNVDPLILQTAARRQAER